MPPENTNPKTCFIGDTYVVTDIGKVEIRDVGIGAMVLSRCEITGEQRYCRVSKTYVHRDVEIYDVVYALEGGGGGWVSTTTDHPFWVNGVGWVGACDLQKGQQMEICDPEGLGKLDSIGVRANAESGKRWAVEVYAVEKTAKTRTVYNLEVDEFHTYFVGDHGIWVHN